MINTKKERKNQIARSLIALFTFALVCTLSASTLPSTSAQVYTAPGNVNFRVTLINQDPDPVEPGGFVDVRFKIENIGTKRAENPSFEIITTAPLSVLPSEANKTTGSIGGFQTGDDAVIIKYRLSVDSKANKGTGKVTLKYRYDNSSPVTETSPFDISISSSNAIVLIKDVSINPELINPGKSFEVNTVIKNTADSYVKNVRVSLDLSSASTPFAPINSTNEKAIEVLDSQESANINFILAAEPSAAANLYKLPIEITYFDSDGVNYSTSYVTGILVGDSPKIDVIFLDTTICEAGKEGTVKFKIYNKENINVKFLEATIRNSSDYKIIGPEKIYVGKLDSDDYEEVEYTIQLSKNPESIPLLLSFKDSNNNQYVEPQNIAFKMCTKDSSKNGNGAGIYLLIAILIIGALAYFFILKKKDKTKKS